MAAALSYLYVSQNLVGVVIYCLFQHFQIRTVLFPSNGGTIRIDAQYSYILQYVLLSTYYLFHCVDKVYFQLL